MKKYLMLSCLILMASLCYADGLIGGTGGGAAATAFLNTPTLQTGNYTALCGDVILASSTNNGVGITITLPTAASCNGKPITVEKVDNDTYPVTINTANATDVMQGTQTLVLYAYTQTDAMTGSTINQWVPWGQGFQITPNYLSPAPFGQVSNFTVGTSSNIVVCPMEQMNIPVCVTGVSYDEGATGGSLATMSWGLLDRSGRVVVSSNSISMTMSGLGRDVSLLTTPTCIPPGAYYLAVQFSNTTTNIEGANESNNGMAGCSAIGATSAGIVNVTLPGSAVTTVPGMRILISGGRQTYL